MSVTANVYMTALQKGQYTQTSFGKFVVTKAGQIRFYPEQESRHQVNVVEPHTAKRKAVGRFVVVREGTVLEHGTERFHIHKDQPRRRVPTVAQKKPRRRLPTVVG